MPNTIFYQLANTLMALQYLDKYVGVEQKVIHRVSCADNLLDCPRRSLYRRKDPIVFSCSSLCDPAILAFANEDLCFFLQ